jgi:hypothetical protein
MNTRYIKGSLKKLGMGTNTVSNAGSTSSIRSWHAADQQDRQHQHFRLMFGDSIFCVSCTNSFGSFAMQYGDKEKEARIRIVATAMIFVATYKGLFSPHTKGLATKFVHAIVVMTEECRISIKNAEAVLTVSRMYEEVCRTGYKVLSNCYLSSSKIKEIVDPAYRSMMERIYLTRKYVYDEGFRNPIKYDSVAYLSLVQRADKYHENSRFSNISSRAPTESNYVDEPSIFYGRTVETAYGYFTACLNEGEKAQRQYKMTVAAQHANAILEVNRTVRGHY